MQAQIISAGDVVVNAIVVPSEATVTDGGASVSWGEGESAIAIDAPEGCAFMIQEGAAIGWALEGGALVAPPQFTPPLTADDLVALARTARKAKEYAGVTVGGVHIQTDEISQSKLLGVRVAASENAAFTTPWVAADGSIVPMTAEMIVVISNAVLAHVQGCFVTFADVVEQITAGRIVSPEQIQAAFA